MSWYAYYLFVFVFYNSVLKGGRQTQNTDAQLMKINASCSLVVAAAPSPSKNRIRLRRRRPAAR